MTAIASLVKSFRLETKKDLNLYFVKSPLVVTLEAWKEESETTAQVVVDVSANCSDENLWRLIQANRYSITLNINEENNTINVDVAINTAVNIDGQDIDDFFPFVGKVILPTRYFKKDVA